MSDETQKSGGAAPAATTTDASLLDEILHETQLKPTDEGYDVTKQGIGALVKELLSPKHQGEKVDKAFADALIADIDAKISQQLDVILHHPDLQKLESAWRGLKFVVDRTDFRENIKIEVLNVSKQDLLTDFEDTPEITKSGLYKIAYTAEYGTLGGKPYGAMFSNYEFGPSPQDVQLLQNVAAVGAMSHAPFFGAAAPQFFGNKDYSKLPNLPDLHATFEGPLYTKWRAFRESEDSRYVGLVMPRFLARLPYGNKTAPAKTFNYEEDVVGEHDRYLWANAAYAFATRVTESFAKYRWCPNIIGPQAGGTVENLPLHQYEAMGELQTKCPTEVQISDRREFELSEEGFIALTFRKESDNACFFSASSCQKPKTYGQSAEGKDAELNYRLGTQLPYMFVACRLAHYIKVLQREQIGTWKERLDLENELNRWIKNYVNASENAGQENRAKYPLREAKVVVQPIPGQPGSYNAVAWMRPWLQFEELTTSMRMVASIPKAS